MTFSENEIRAWLEEVKDPEIPTVSIVDLGMIESIQINEDAVFVEVIPTFAGCPALRYIQEDIKSCLERHGVQNPIVTMNRTKPWSTDRITERGRKLILDFGLSPPPKIAPAMIELPILQNAVCPKCFSLDTRLIIPFGPTLCRAIHQCHSCLETFEQFKPL